MSFKSRISVSLITDWFFRDSADNACCKKQTDGRIHQSRYEYNENVRGGSLWGVPLSVVCDDVSRLREVACGSLNSSAGEWDATTILWNCAINRYRKSRLSSTARSVDSGPRMVIYLRFSFNLSVLVTKKLLKASHIKNFLRCVSR